METVFPIDHLREYTEPPEEDLSYLPPEEKKGHSTEQEEPDFLDTLDKASLSDPEIRNRLENLMVRSLFRMLEDEKMGGTIKLGAIKEIKEMLGLDKKSQEAPIAGENVQINNYGSLSPEKAKHLLEGLKGANSIGSAKDSGIKPHSGGKGV